MSTTLPALLLLALAAAPAAPELPQKASFQVKNAFTVKLPPGAKTARVWFAVPQEDGLSEVSNLRFSGGPPVRIAADAAGNRVGYLELRATEKQPLPAQLAFTEEFDLVRSEWRGHPDPAATRPLTERERTALAHYLQPSTYVILDERMRTLSATVVAGEQNPVLATRRIYDWTVANVDYWVKDPEHLKASPTGSSDYCLRTRSGNCSDFHSLFASLAIAAGVPVRIVYGSLFKPTLNGQPVDASYHCWVEFFAPRLGWIPADAAIASLYARPIALDEKNGKLVELTTATGYRGVDPALVDYYFGNLEERRVVWSVGRDLVLSPPQDDGPLNLLTKAYVEVDGKAHTDWTRQLTYLAK